MRPLESTDDIAVVLQLHHLTTDAMIDSTFLHPALIEAAAEIRRLHPIKRILFLEVTVPRNQRAVQSALEKIRISSAMVVVPMTSDGVIDRFEIYVQLYCIVIRSPTGTEIEENLRRPGVQQKRQPMLSRQRLLLASVVIHDCGQLHIHTSIFSCQFTICSDSFIIALSEMDFIVLQHK